LDVNTLGSKFGAYSLVADPARKTIVLPRHSARRLALLEKASLVDCEDRLVIAQMLDDLIAEDIAKHLSIPIPVAQDRLLTPWAGITSCLSPRIQPVLPWASPSRPSRNQPAFVAARSCSNNGCIRLLICPSDAAHNASVSSIDAACVRDLPNMVAHDFRNQQKRQL
jgi:capsular polysaccharide biosynthesis protein